jgi:hypothetical protein
MAQSSKLTCPVMGAAAGLHRHHTGGLASEELQNLLASQPLTEDYLAGSIRPVRLKDVLRQIQADRDTLRHGRLLLSGDRPPLWHTKAVGEASTPSQHLTTHAEVINQDPSRSGL